MPKLHLFLILSLFAACQNSQQGASTVPESTAPQISTADTAIVGREMAAKEKQVANLGQQLSIIPIRSKAEKDELKNPDNGIMPWFTIDSAQQKIANLIDPDELVLSYQKVKIMFDYPLAKPIFLELTSLTKGFTRKQIILAISKKYHEIYEEEEKTAKTKTIPLKDRKKLANRNETDGKYGIWGHDLSDLDLDDIIVHQTSDGSIVLELDIES